MQNTSWPYFPALLTTIGYFLSRAEVRSDQQGALDAARKALETIARVLYPDEQPIPEGAFAKPLAERIYPCTIVAKITNP